MTIKPTIHISRLIVSLMLVLTLAPSVLAAGESYHWQDPAETVLIGQGGSFTSPVELRAAGRTSSAAIFEATYTGSSGCPDGSDLKLRAEIPLTEYQKADPVHGKITATGCEAGLTENITIALAGSAPANGSQTGSSAQALRSNDDCKAEGGLGWILCPIYKLLVNTIESIETSVILPFLKVDPLPVGQTGNLSYNVWSAVKTLADALMVVAFLALIFSHTLSLGLDNYSIKKLLPRLVAASIFIQFSYVLVGFGVDAANIIGAGIGDIVLKPIQGFETTSINNLTGGLGIAAGIAGAMAAVGSVLSGSIIMVLIGAFFTVLLVFVTLVARQILITFLLIMAPLAFAASVLPNTEYLFRKWYKSLIALLLMYPLIVLLFASGKIFGAITVGTNVNGVGGSSMRSLISVVANLVPLFLIPLTFRLAGAALQSADNFIRLLQGGTKVATQKSGAYDRLKTRTEQRKTELAAGQGVNVLGAKVGRNRVASQFGRGAFSGYGAGGNARAMADFSRERAFWDKRLEDEGFTYEGLEVLSKGLAHGQRKLDDAKRTGDLNGQRNWQAGLSEAKRYVNVSAAQSAALKARGKMGVIDDGDRTSLLSYTGRTEAGQLIARQAWTAAGEGARKGSVHLTYTDINGAINVNELRKFVIKQNIATWANYSKDAYEEMAKPSTGILRSMAADSQQRELLKNLLGPRGAGPEQQAIIRRALASVPPPPPPPPPI